MIIKKISQVLTPLVLIAVITVQIFPLFVFAEDVIAPTEPTPPASVIEIAPEPTPSEAVSESVSDQVTPNDGEEEDELVVSNTDEVEINVSGSSEDTVENEEEVLALEEDGLITFPEDISHNLSTTTTLVVATSTDEAFEGYVLGGSAGTTTATSTLEMVGSVGGNGGVTATTTSVKPTIVSGQAVAMANILNIVNTNLVNSNGQVLFLNLLENEENAINFQDYLGGNGAAVCSLLSCGAQDGVQVNLLSDAYIENQIQVHASSGDNEILGGDSATIQTGNAYAGLNLVNIANTNFIDSNYLLVTLNAFNGVSGDIVFPNLQKFFASLASSSSAPYSMNLNNHADILNEVETGAESGNNTILGSEMMTINTGNSVSSSNVFNQINTNLSEDNKVSILFRVHGNWLGEILGAPSNLLQTQGLNGDFYFTNASPSLSSATGLLGKVSATSTARILNDVSVTALTGNNEITGADTALISTGNAFAGANLVNIANANVIGRNWIFAIINIFGDFKGNIAFGSPDLWVGEQIDAPVSIQNGTEVTYKFTVINNGDLPATNVVLTDVYDVAHIDVLESTLEYTVNHDGHLVWNIGTLPVGGATEVKYKARIKGAGFGTNITNVVTATLKERDNNFVDNTDTATLKTDEMPATGSAYLSYANSTTNLTDTDEEVSSLKFTVSRVTASSTISTTSPRTVIQKLVLKNPEPKDIERVFLHDVLRDPLGNIVSAEYFDLGMVLANEEITIEYEIVFAQNAKPGNYKLFTVINSGARSLAFESNGSINLIGETVLIPVIDIPLVQNIASTTLRIPDDEQETIAAVFTKAEELTEIKKEIFPKELLTDVVGLRIAHADQSNLAGAAFESEQSIKDILQIILLIFVVALSVAGLNKIRIILSR